MEKKNLTILIILGVIIFIIGWAMGMAYQVKQYSPQVAKSQIVEQLSSSVVASIAAYGEVTKIEGRNLTLQSYNKEVLTIPIAEDARIHTLNRPSQGNEKINEPQPVKQGDLSQIKIGDWVNVNIKVYPEGRIEGNLVVVLNPINPSK